MRSINIYEKILETYGYKAIPEDTDIQDEIISFHYTKEEKYVWIDVDKNSTEIEKIFISCSMFWTNDGEYGGPGIILYKDPDEYEKYSLDLFEETVKAVDNPLIQELKIAEAHAKNLRWVYDILWPVLKDFGYRTEGVGMIDRHLSEDAEEFSIYFEKTDDQFHENYIWASTDKFTGELEVSIRGLDENLAWKDSEILKTMIETCWEKE